MTRACCGDLPSILGPATCSRLEVVHGIPAHVPKWGKGFKAWLQDNYLHLFRLYSQHSSLPMVQHYCDLDPTTLDPYGQPTLRITHEWTEYDRRSVEYFMKVNARLRARAWYERDLGGLADPKLSHHRS